MGRFIPYGTGRLFELRIFLQNKCLEFRCFDVLQIGDHPSEIALIPCTRPKSNVYIVLVERPSIITYILYTLHPLQNLKGIINHPLPIPPTARNPHNPIQPPIFPSIISLKRQMQSHLIIMRCILIFLPQRLQNLPRTSANTRCSKIYTVVIMSHEIVPGIQVRGL